eukprot:CAMPEP_0113282042 /NCGR_PEP_ID=MMETSP0008_2-20120614/28633_1 /TAXON_ID=97485 /ORGANISM="Prymnesium parvum" /LENGTH=48 /DNA_ID=CAMNT_0000132519 /DNA_START=115 /DNA_END=258 /DNA_ORIENTATION=- /assembly_acc=CAM_ASM_000153
MKGNADKARNLLHSRAAGLSMALKERSPGDEKVDEAGALSPWAPACTG